MPKILITYEIYFGKIRVINVIYIGQNWVSYGKVIGNIWKVIDKIRVREG